MPIDDPEYEAFLQSATTAAMVLRYEAARREGERLAETMAAILKVRPKAVSSASYRASAGRIVAAIRRILSREPGAFPVSRIPQGETEVPLADLHLAVTLSLTALERFRKRYLLWEAEDRMHYWHTRDREVPVEGQRFRPVVFGDEEDEEEEE